MFINIPSEQHLTSPPQILHSPKAAWVFSAFPFCASLQPHQPPSSPPIAHRPLKCHILPCFYIFSPQVLQTPRNTQQSWKLLPPIKSITHIRVVYVDPAPVYFIFLPHIASKMFLLRFGQQHLTLDNQQESYIARAYNHMCFASWSLVTVVTKWKQTRCRKRLQKSVWKEVFFFLFFLEGRLEELRLFSLAKWRGTAERKVREDMFALY